ncbi:hypothetical protein [Melaminivora alkalimesophila]|uniref:Uncharacterized protein n=1 Tax=Melaminivora alkalimesophila TaxID=1165852 RepID=A0A317RCP8_9BURK|nr:hypothetical protein [Melaminivora alkalimesophila]PWW47686.1 hypothetical protein DFR36_10259 [Melaminivora alkalimesophila]
MQPSIPALTAQQAATRQTWLALAGAWPAPLGLVLGLAHPLAAVAVAPPPLDATAAQSWPRVFYTPQQREDIERARTRLPEGEPSTPQAAEHPGDAVAAVDEPISVLVLQGTARGRHGATAWINGQMLQDGESLAGYRVQVLPDGRVRLSRVGAGDVVLLPGQQVSVVDDIRQDVLPAGALLEITTQPQRSHSKQK